MTDVVKKLNFQTGFDLTQLPSKQYNVSLDLSEIAAGGELGGTMDAPTVDATHSGSAHHAAVTIGADAEHSLAAQVLSGVDAAAAQKGHVQLAGDLGGTADAPTVNATHSGSAHHAPAHGPTQHTEGTAWRLVYQDANGDEQEIVLGAAGTVLTSDGASVAPSFQAAGTSIQAPWGLWVPDPMVAVGNATWSYANRAQFLPFTVLTTVTITRVLIHVVTQSGNLDVGIYNASRTRLVSSGSVAVGTAGDGQIINIADTELVAGRYYFAMVVDNTTASFVRSVSYSSVLGRWQYEASAFPLPASVAAFDGFYNYAPVAFLEISGGISAS